MDGLNKVREGLEAKWKSKDDAVGAAKKNYSNLLEQVEALLLLLRNARQMRDQSRNRIKSLQDRLKLGSQSLQEYEHVLVKQYYVQQNLRIRTPWGEGRILSYDNITDRVKVRLLWNIKCSSRYVATEFTGTARELADDPTSATPPLAPIAIMPAELIMKEERTRQGEERRLMAQEDTRCRVVRAYWRKIEALEVKGMSADDHYAQQLRNVELLNTREEAHVVKALRIIVEDCRALFADKEEDEDSVRAYKPIADEVDRRVGDVVAEAKRAMDEYKVNGGPTKPKQLTAKQVKAMREQFRKDVEAQYIEAKSIAAERDIRVAYVFEWSHLDST